MARRAESGQQAQGGEGPSRTPAVIPQQSEAPGAPSSSLTGTSLGAALPVLILWALARCSPEEGP